LSFESDWLEQAGERKAKKMIGNMVQYLRKFEADGASVIGREVSFEFEIGKALVRGQVDRLELYPDGRVMIVDLKTGSKAFTAEEAREHAQLGLYQLAFENGAFDLANGNEVIWPADFDPKTAKLAGAKLLLVSGDKPTEREQGSIAEDSSAKQKFESIVAAATRGMAMTEQVFVAQVGSHCTNENEFGSCQIHLTRAVSYVG
jgi:RecB family exonuclease